MRLPHPYLLGAWALAAFMLWQITAPKARPFLAMVGG